MAGRSSREWNSAAYHRLSGPQTSWGKKVISRLRLRGDETVLDAGCGTGRLTAELLGVLPGGRVVGIDLSLNMLTTAREHLQRDLGPRVSLVVANLFQLPFVRAFDGIVSTAAFHWVLDHDRLFANLFQALRPGGWLEAQCGGGPNLAQLRNRVHALSASPDYARFLASFPEPWFFADAESAANTLRRTGFSDVKTGVEPAPTVLRDAAEYSEFIETMILRQHLQRIPEKSLRARFLSRLTELAAADDPPYCLDYWRLNLSARVPVTFVPQPARNFKRK